MPNINVQYNHKTYSEKAQPMRIVPDNCYTKACLENILVPQHAC